MKEIARKLTDSKVKALKTDDKVIKLYDGGGLYLQVNKAGSKLWRYKYRINKIEGVYALGKYPQLTLAEARAEHDKARALVEKNIKPLTLKNERIAEMERVEHDFDYYMKRWLNKQTLAKSTIKDLRQRIEKNLSPYLNGKRIDEHTPKSLLAVVEKMVKRGAIETAHRLSSILRNIFDEPVFLGVINSNPAEGLKRQLPKKPKAKQFAHITDPNNLRKLLLAMDVVKPREDIAVTLALKFMPLVFLRPSNIRFLRWKNINWDEKRIYFSSDDMKMSKAFIIPLSKQAIEILKEMQLLTGEIEYVFSTSHGWGKPMGESTTTGAIHRMIDSDTGKAFGKNFMSSHGFRHTADTFLNEMKFNADIIEVQLAHLNKDSMRATYNKGEWLPDRHDMMQRWADYLDELKNDSG